MLDPFYNLSRTRSFRFKILNNKANLNNQSK